MGGLGGRGCGLTRAQELAPALLDARLRGDTRPPRRARARAAQLPCGPRWPGRAPATAALRWAGAGTGAAHSPVRLRPLSSVHRQACGATRAAPPQTGSRGRTPQRCPATTPALCTRSAARPALSAGAAAAAAPALSWRPRPPPPPLRQIAQRGAVVGNCAAGTCLRHSAPSADHPDHCGIQCTSSFSAPRAMDTLTGGLSFQSAVCACAGAYQRAPLQLRTDPGLDLLQSRVARLLTAITAASQLRVAAVATWQLQRPPEYGLAACRVPAVPSPGDANEPGPAATLGPRAHRPAAARPPAATPAAPTPPRAPPPPGPAP